MNEVFVKDTVNVSLNWKQTHLLALLEKLFH